MGRFDKFIGEAKAESEARIKEKEEEQRVQKEEEDARHLHERSLFELHILPIIRDAEISCQTYDIYSTLKTSLDTRGKRESKWINFELHGPPLPDLVGDELSNTRSDELHIALVDGDVIFRIGRGQDSLYSQHSLDKSSIEDVNSIEAIANRSIRALIRSYFLAKEKQEK